MAAGYAVEPLFNAFATASFFEFVHFAIFEMQYLLSIWRARQFSPGHMASPARAGHPVCMLLRSINGQHLLDLPIVLVAEVSHSRLLQEKKEEQMSLHVAKKALRALSFADSFIN